MEFAKSYDAAVIGGGPAGATVARLLAQWGHSVIVLDRSPSRKPALAETLPPSICKLFQFLGVQDQVDAAGFYRTSGNTAWWGGRRRRVEPYPDGEGYQVLRSDFDRLLLELTEAAGARMERDATVRSADWEAGQLKLESIEIRAGYVLDCSGRAGVMARQGFRRREPGSRTVGVCGIWRRPEGWKAANETHTLVEAYQDGWAWSIPLSPALRYVTVMVDGRDTRMAHGRGLAGAYQAELAKTRALRKTLSGATLERTPWGCDASTYSAHRYVGGNGLLVGDAGSFIDPLSSFGVKKAMASAWVAAVVVNTCLRRPEMRQAALDFFEEREREVYAGFAKQSALQFGKVAARNPNAFWTRRSEGVEMPSMEERAAVAAAFEKLKRSPALRLRRAPGVRTEQRAEIAGREVVLAEAVAGMRFMNGVNLPKLVEIARDHSQAPDMFEAYNRVCPPAALPEFLGALSFLVAKGVMQ